MKIFLLTALFSISLLANSAGPLAPLDLGGKQLLSPVGDLHVLTQAIERGLPLISTVGGGTPVPSRGSHNDEYNVIMENNRKAQEDSLVKYQKNLRESLALRNARHKGLPPPDATAQPKAVEVPAAVRVDKYSEKSAHDFCRCAPHALRALKLTRRVSGLGKEFEAAQLQSLLGDVRGDGEFVSINGLLCGSYLGEFGMPVDGALTEIQILSALSKPGDRETSEHMFHYFALYSAVTRGKVLEAPLFWRYAWKKVSFQRVMTQERTPPPQTLIKDFIETQRLDFKDATRTVRFVPDSKEVERAVLKDWTSIAIPEHPISCGAIK